MKAAHTHGIKTAIQLTEFIWPLSDETQAVFERVILTEAQKILEYVFNGEGYGIHFSLPFTENYRRDDSVVDPLTLRFSYLDFEVSGEGEEESTFPQFDVSLREIIENGLSNGGDPCRWRQAAKAFRELADMIDEGIVEEAENPCKSDEKTAFHVAFTAPYERFSVFVSAATAAEAVQSVMADDPQRVILGCEALSSKKTEKLKAFAQVGARAGGDGWAI